MGGDDERDIPYGEDFHDEAVAAEWADAAARKRPFRTMLFDRFAKVVGESKVAAPRVLELGSGPGFLAEHVLDRCPSIARYTLLDFSAAMLELSRKRLERHAHRIALVQEDFKSEPWPAAAGAPFDLVLSLQAVHELRHKRHAPRLFEQTRALLAPQGILAICDHLPQGAHTPRHVVLYMAAPEYLAVLSAAGFSAPKLVWSEHAMAMYQAEG